MTADPQALTVTVPTDLATTEAAVREALAEQGFGVLTEIDVEATFRARLGDREADEIGPTRILGACNPGLAYQALRAAPDVSALLPCNVVLRAADGGTEVVAVDPLAMLEVASEDLGPVATEARRRLAAALEQLTA